MPRIWDLEKWMVFQREDTARAEGVEDAFLDSVASASSLSPKPRRHRPKQPFLLGPGGVADPRINAYFDSAERRGLKAGTNKKAAYALSTWLNYLAIVGSSWDAATSDDIEDYADWRLRDPANERLIQGGTWHGEITQLLVFYRWAYRTYGVRNPILSSASGRAAASSTRPDVSASSNRQSDIKWVSPAAQARWRDIGILGIDGNGVEKTAWRPRCEARDLAFVEGLYRTGLRMQEWSSVLVQELPGPDDDRGFFTLRLASACAKGDLGHRYWIDRIGLDHVREYVEGERAEAVAAAQRAGRYDEVKGKVVIAAFLAHETKVRLRDDSGAESVRAIDTLSPDARLRLFTETTEGLEPAMLFLNEDGMPRSKIAWYKTFGRINARVRRAGVKNLWLHPHMLRHSFALRWYTVGKLIREHQFGHLTDEEARDFRAEFGSTWHLVQTMLGHRNTETTKQTYLEPFIGLSIELLLEHATDDVTVRQLLEATLTSHPSVITLGETAR